MINVFVSLRFARLVNTAFFLYSGRGAACPRAADIVLALDQSSSIVLDDPNYDNWYVSMLGFATSIVQAFPISPNLTRVSRFRICDTF